MPTLQQLEDEYKTLKKLVDAALTSTSYEEKDNALTQVRQSQVILHSYGT